jgi:tRNA threonylcarbamoyladenosine biosynthesis protein TsaE
MSDQTSLTDNPSFAIHSCQLFLPAEEQTSALGRWLAPRLTAGDTLLLEGAIGAGKSHLARALIRARLGSDEDIPSPTYTLVQVYEPASAAEADTDADTGAAGSTPEIWHADLYRLGHPDEVVELGLEAAFRTAICLVEWPDRLGSLRPEKAISIRLSLWAEGRCLDISGPEGLIAALRRDWAPCLGRDPCLGRNLCEDE